VPLGGLHLKAQEHALLARDGQADDLADERSGRQLDPLPATGLQQDGCDYLGLLTTLPAKTSLKRVFMISPQMVGELDIQFKRGFPQIGSGGWG
jgi:hypothetical protein